jgi:predicted PurR-regulated permease PerM
MLKKKICIFACLFFSLVLPLVALAATDPVDGSVDAAKNALEQKAPEVVKYWNAEVLPFLQKAYDNTNNWLKENMPAAAKEFQEESRSLPTELWDAIKNGVNWIISFFKR